MGIDWGLERGKRFKTTKNKGKYPHLQVRVLTGKEAQGPDCYCRSSEDQEVKETTTTTTKMAVGPLLTLILWGVQRMAMRVQGKTKINCNE